MRSSQSSLAAKPVTSSDMSWSCQACTYEHVNKVEFEFLACKICQTKRKDGPTSHASPSTSAQRFAKSTPLQRQSLKRKRPAGSSGLRSVNEVLRGKKWSTFHPTPKVRIRNRWVDVPDAEVSKYAPLSLVKDVLDKAQAAELLKEMRNDVTWKTYKWHVVGKAVDVKRKACTLLLEKDSGAEEYEFSKAKQRGSELVHTAAQKVVEVVNKLRPKVDWKPTYTLANRYMDGSETVGFHSDHLAEIGPQAIIVGLSLGAARRFDMKRAEPAEAEDSADAVQVYAPHNSAIIMWAGSQENWQHAVPRCDNSRVYRHKTVGLERYSLTFRMRRTDMPKFESVLLFFVLSRI